MAIDRVQFGDALINKNLKLPEQKPDITEQNSNNQNQPTEQVQTTDQPAQINEETQQQEPTTEKESHTTRNAVLVTAGLALVTLGIVGGRKGKLGPGIQKALGGGERTVEHKPGSLDGTAEHIDDIKSTSTDATGENAGKIVREDAVVEEKTDAVIHNEIQVEGDNVNKSIHDEQTVTVAEDSVIDLKTVLTETKKAEIDKLIDRSVPEIPKNMLKIEASQKVSMKALKEMGFDLEKINLEGTPYSCVEYNAKDGKLFAKYDAEGKLCTIEKKDTQSNDVICHVKVENNKIKSYAKDGLVTYYNVKGKIDYFVRPDCYNTESIGTYCYDAKGYLKELNNFGKYITFYPKTTKPQKIRYYYDIDSLDNKTEYFDKKGRLILEKYEVNGEIYDYYYPQPISWIDKVKRFFKLLIEEED